MYIGKMKENCGWKQIKKTTINSTRNKLECLSINDTHFQFFWGFYFLQMEQTTLIRMLVKDFMAFTDDTNQCFRMFNWGTNRSRITSDYRYAVWFPLAHFLSREAITEKLRKQIHDKATAQEKINERAVKIRPPITRSNSVTDEGYKM